MRSHGATLSHTENFGASRNAVKDFTREEASVLVDVWKSEGCDQNVKSFNGATTVGGKGDMLAARITFF